jgi:hypothetical protein
LVNDRGILQKVLAQSFLRPKGSRGC